MKLCICDDDKTMHEKIRQCLQPFFTESQMPQITDFFKGEDLVEHYSSGKDFDIVFLDIEMDKMNGIDTATEVRKYAPEAIIIFVSSHKNYVFDAFRCEAFHFLVKLSEYIFNRREFLSSHTFRCFQIPTTYFVRIFYGCFQNGRHSC